MTVLDVKKQIVENTLGNFYIFTGEELFVQNAYVNKIAEVMKKPIRRVDNVSSVIKSSGLSLFHESFCYVCRDDMSFYKAEDAWDKVLLGLGDNVLIVQYTTIDARSKFHNRFSDQIISFDHLDKRILTKYIQQEMSISNHNCETLIDVCEQDYSRIRLELDKVVEWKKGYAKDKEMEMPDDNALLHLLNDGTIYIPPKDVIFDWVHAVLKGQPTLSFKLYEECLEIGEMSLRLLLVLFNGAKHLLQVQSCKGNISESTGLSLWEIKQVSDCVDIYRNYELVHAMHLIHEMEYGIKTGMVEEAFAVPYVMLSMLGAYDE